MVNLKPFYNIIHREMIRMYSRKRIHRKTNTGKSMCTITLLLVLFFVCSFAGTSSVHTNMLYQHPYFADMHWRITSDLITYKLSPGFTTLTPVKASFAENDTNSITLFSATDSKLYLMSVALKPETEQNKAVITTRDPIESPVGTVGSPFEIFAPGTNKIDTVFVATVLGTDKVLVHHIAIQSFTVTRVDTLAIAPPSGSYTVLALFGGPDFALTGQSGIWIIGSYGLVRYFTWNESSWGAEVVHDIDTTETITALCKEALGTASGKIYEFISNAFTYKSQPVAASIHRISTLGAVSGGGKVIKRKGTSWEPFTTVGAGNYHYFNFIARTNGSGVELLDNAWKFYVYTLEDSASTFDIEPANVANYINNGIYKFMEGQETVIIKLIDPDENALIPEIKLRNSINLVDSLERAHPDTLWSLGFSDLADTVITLELRRDSVIVTAKIRSGAFNPVTYKKSWVQLEYRRAEKWRLYDTISIKLGNRTLLIELDTQAVGIVETNKLRKNRPIQILRNSSQLTFTIPPNSVRYVRICNLQGQQIASATISPNANIVTIPIRMSSGIICIEYILSSGKAIRETVPVVK